MEYSRIVITSQQMKSINSAKRNAVISMPEFSSKIIGKIDSVSHEGFINISSSRGTFKFLTNGKIRAGCDVEISLNDDNSQLHLRIINTNIEVADKSLADLDIDDEHITFNVPNNQKTKLLVNSSNYLNLYEVSKNDKTRGDNSKMSVDNRGIIAFLSYVESGELSDTFGRALSINPKLLILYPGFNNLIDGIPGFIQALRKGDLDNVLPTKIREDLNSLQMLTKSLSDNNWDFFMVPLNDGQKLLPLKIFVEKEKVKDDGLLSQSSKRFHIEVKLDCLGDLILEGLMQTRNKDKILNITVKSDKPLQKNLMDEIEYLFHVSNEMSGNRIGDLRFKVCDIKTNSMLADAIHAYCKERIKNIII